MTATTSAQTGSAQKSSAMSRVQLIVVTLGYVGVVFVSGALLFARHLQYVKYATEVDASGGMWAFGDWMLELSIAGLLLIPTLLLAFFIRNAEPAYTRYSQVLLGVALTAPACIGALFIPAVSQGNSGFLADLGWFCLGRISAAPVVLGGMFLSWLFARFKRAKRLIMYGLLAELGTYALVIAAVVLPWHRK